MSDVLYHLIYHMLSKRASEASNMPLIALSGRFAAYGYTGRMCKGRIHIYSGTYTALNLKEKAFMLCAGF